MRRYLIGLAAGLITAVLGCGSDRDLDDPSSKVPSITKCEPANGAIFNTNEDNHIKPEIETYIRQRGVDIDSWITLDGEEVPSGIAIPIWDLDLGQHKLECYAQIGENIATKVWSKHKFTIIDSYRPEITTCLPAAGTVFDKSKQGLLEVMVDAEDKDGDSLDISIYLDDTRAESGTKFILDNLDNGTHQVRCIAEETGTSTAYKTEQVNEIEIVGEANPDNDPPGEITFMSLEFGAEGYILGDEPVYNLDNNDHHGITATFTAPQEPDGDRMRTEIEVTGPGIRSIIKQDFKHTDQATQGFFSPRTYCVGECPIGTYTFTASAKDPSGEKSTASIDVEIVEPSNRAPVFSNDYKIRQWYIGKELLIEEIRATDPDRTPVILTIHEQDIPGNTITFMDASTIMTPNSVTQEGPYTITLRAQEDRNEDGLADEHGLTTDLTIAGVIQPFETYIDFYHPMAPTMTIRAPNELVDRIMAPHPDFELNAERSPYTIDLERNPDELAMIIQNYRDMKDDERLPYINDNYETTSSTILEYDDEGMLQVIKATVLDHN